MVEDLIKNIKAKKAELNLTNAELSEKSGVPLGTLNKILSGAANGVKAQTLFKLNAALGLSYDTAVLPSDKVVAAKNDTSASVQGVKNYGFVKVAACSPAHRVADVKYNVAEIKKSIFEARDKGVAVLVFPECSITAYTVGDLVYQDALLNAARAGLKDIAEYTRGINMLIFVGLPLKKDGAIYNVAAAVFNGEVLGFTAKTFIPNYNEFYEKRHFKPSPEAVERVRFYGKDLPFGNKIIYRSDVMENFTVAAEICEDLWVAAPPSVKNALHGAMINVNLSASDEIIGKAEYRRTLISAHSGAIVGAYVYADAGVGESTTDMVFAGHDLIYENGRRLAESELFEGGFITADVDVDYLAFERSKLYNYDYNLSEGFETVYFSYSPEIKNFERVYAKTPFVPRSGAEIADRAELILNMQAHALARRAEHARAKTLVIGVSGGLDSTLALLVCVRAMKILSRSEKDVLAVTMPCFGTTKRTKSNAAVLSEGLGVTLKEVDITAAVRAHFNDIGQSEEVTDVTYENSQARERTQVLMDLANKTGGIVVGTGDLSELALGWATYNGDHMSMYAVNSSVPKTLIRYLVAHEAKRSEKEVKDALLDILDTPVSPELIPPKDGEISQRTEDIVGPYILHDFYLFYAVRMGFTPSKIYFIAKKTFAKDYDDETLYKWLKNFYNRFFTQQFKRSCIPDGVKIGSLTLSPRGDWRMPSDAVRDLWLEDLKNIKPSV